MNSYSIHQINYIIKLSIKFILIDNLFSIEQNPSNTLFVYLLKQIDADSRFKYFGTKVEIGASETAKINCNIITNGLRFNQNYPNPFNPTTVISYKLYIKSLLLLKVFDIQGLKIILPVLMLIELAKIFQAELIFTD